MINPKSDQEVNRRKRILSALKKLYPEPESELNFHNEYQLLISVVLSAQCTDKKVNEVTPELFSKYPNAHELSKATIPELEKIIRPINYYKSKAKHLSLLGQRLSTIFGGVVPKNAEELRSLAGVGQKTANVVLGELKAAKTFPVDTHVFRVSKRLGFAFSEKREKVEEELKELFDPRQWRNLHHWLILHGRRVCKAQNPLCDSCLIAKDCRYKNINRPLA